MSLKAEDTRQWGVMTAGEMVCHLRGAFRVAMGEIACSPVKVPMPRRVLKTAALWVPLRWKENFPTVTPLQRGSAYLEVVDFQADRAGAVTEMERFCRPDAVRADHAFFGPMSIADWMRWGYLHTDHHLRQFGR